MMVRLCLLRFVLWSCFTFLVPGEPLALQRQHALEGALVRYEKAVAAPDGSIVSLQTQHELVGAVSAPAFSSKLKIGGRKMVMQNVTRNEMTEEEEFIGGDAPKATGTIFFENKGKDELNVGCKLNGRNLLQMKFKRDGLAFTADYHVPKPHPPKNN